MIGGICWKNTSGKNQRYGVDLVKVLRGDQAGKGECVRSCQESRCVLTERAKVQKKGVPFTRLSIEFKRWTGLKERETGKVEGAIKTEGTVTNIGSRVTWSSRQ